MSKFDYDLITIGAGSGGVRASRFATTRYGARAAVIEKSRIGGTCVMRGCVPKKLLIYGAHYAEEFENARGYGWGECETHFDWRALIDAKNRELDRLEGIYRRILREAKVDSIEGTGKIVDPHSVEVDGKTYTTKNILVATGGWPTMPDVPGIEHVITSNEALELAELPKKLVIVGGGFIAVEFAGIFAAVGVEVHIIIRADNILRGFDDAIRNTLRDEMTKKGIHIHSDCRIKSIERENGGYSLRLDEVDLIEADLVMYATGRKPATAGIGLTEAGVVLNDNGAIIVDDYYKTSVDSIYAIGDVTDRVNLTPVAIEEGMAVAKTLFGGKPTKLDYTNIPAAVFSQPPVGTVGLSEAEARALGEVDIYMSHFRPMKHTMSGRDEHAMMKLVVDRATDRVLGCHMVGTDAPEIVQGFAVALKCGATKAQFDETIGIHPTSAEEFVTMSEKLPESDE